MSLDIKDTSAAIEPDFRSDKSAVSSKCKILSLKAMRIIAVKGTTFTMDCCSLYVLFSWHTPRDILKRLFLLPFHNLCVQMHVHIICAQISRCKRWNSKKRHPVYIRKTICANKTGHLRFLNDFSKTSTGYKCLQNCFVSQFEFL